MDDTSILVRLLFVLGVTFILVGTLTPGGDSAWNSFTDRIQDRPDFNNPFDRQEQRFTAFPDYPANIDNTTGQALPQLHGCTDTLVNVSYCINTPDGADTYIQFNSTDTAQIVTFNWSRTDFASIPASRVVYIHVDIDCWTISGPSLEFYIVWAWNLAGNNENSCPVADYPVRISLQFDCPNGCGTNTTFPWESHPFAMASIQHSANNTASAPSQARFTFLRIEIGVITTQSATCRAPDGAWFPWADEVACAIAQFGHVVWKGIQFVTNGLIFTGQIVVYLITTIYEFFALVAYFLAVPGAPVIVQALFTLIVVGMILAVILIVLGRVRGSGNPV